MQTRYKLFSASMLAMRGSNIRHQAAGIWAASVAEAVGYATLECQKRFPHTEGWVNHNVAVQDSDDYARERLALPAVAPVSQHFFVLAVGDNEGETSKPDAHFLVRSTHPIREVKVAYEITATELALDLRDLCFGNDPDSLGEDEFPWTISDYEFITLIRAFPALMGSIKRRNRDSSTKFSYTHRNTLMPKDFADLWCAYVTRYTNIKLEYVENAVIPIGGYGTLLRY